MEEKSLLSCLRTETLDALVVALSDVIEEVRASDHDLPSLLKDEHYVMCVYLVDLTIAALRERVLNPSRRCVDRVK